ncbi:DUF397 domain-containing protein [Streptomyces verrucosisporus]|uniref:DUF397 domain-containing protein n=1 Tax=Streptomyces TaxID=1883 RepID=UPI0019D11EE6|nr:MULTISPECIES: DUF397 domain-containing protein [Streptomyces]MBN3928194.1 DUF397 domain-containing protein [Streptomyces verrucosisporus]MCI0386171.1 DUF397 domain-containing protein [Streptomyces sp. CNQ085]
MKSTRHSTPDLSVATWRSSTHSGGNNECVEVADDVPGIVPVRDSKRPAGPVLGVSPDAWAAFLDHLR